MKFNSYKQRVASNIKSARKEAGMTQEDMQKYGFNWRHYQEVEVGRINISLETLFRRSKIFKVPVSKLVSEISRN